MKLLIYSDYTCATGFANVMKNIVEQLLKNMPNSFTIDILAIGYYNQPFKENERVKVLPAYSEKLEAGDIYGRKNLLKQIRENEYDKVLFLNDLQLISPLSPLLNILKIEKKKLNTPIDFIFYFPVDSIPHKWHIFNQANNGCLLDVFDELITYTEYGKSEILKIIKSVNTNLVYKYTDKIKVIPHGVEKRFKEKILPDNDEIEKFKRDYFKISKDTFLIGQVNRNSVRKDFTTSLIAYKMFLNSFGENVPDIRYYCHCNPFDQMGYNLFEICAQLEIPAKNILFTPKEFNENSGLNIETLKVIYGCFDLFLTTTTAEGWGLTVTEAMAMKIPVIAPVHTSLTEISDNGCLFYQKLFNFENVFFQNDGNYVRYKSLNKDVSDALLKSYHGLKENKDPEVVEKAYHKVLKYNWAEIGKKWAEILNSKIKVVKSMEVIRGLKL